MNFDRRREITPIFAASLSGNDSLSRWPIIKRDQGLYRPAKNSVAFASLNELLGIAVRRNAPCDGEHSASAASQAIHDGGADSLAATRNEDSLAGEFVTVKWDFGNVHSMCTSR
jgi:hypothetical protein